MKMTNKIARLLSVVISLVLIVAMALSMTACKKTDVESSVPSSSDVTSTAAATEVGEGATKFSFRVTTLDGKSTDFIVATDKTIVGEALLDAKLIEGENSEYGLFVKKVNGIVADFNVDKTYWAFYVDGNYGAKGVDQTEIEAGKLYEFRVSK